jgi:hypothetical protein
MMAIVVKPIVAKTDRSMQDLLVPFWQQSVVSEDLVISNDPSGYLPIDFV